ncbi:hypothetical protein SDJN02_24201, partial [Cucurbita argyrosperma subsp. argyrosperma]
MFMGFSLKKLSSHHSDARKRSTSNPITAAMTDYAQEQEMEIDALEAILMDEFKDTLFYLYSISEIHSSESGLNTCGRCFLITLSHQEMQ